MAISYSFHISNGKNSISDIKKISKVDKHNFRKYNSTGYNKNLNVNLIGTENVLNDLKKIYEEEFEESRLEYNQKQKRKDRKIENYFDNVSNSKKDLAVEIIIQVGDMEFWQNKNINDRKKMNTVFKNQIDKLENLLPNFKISNAIIHYDEKSPHLHIVGVPIADNFKNGMKKQVAKSKIFTKETLENLQNKMRENIETEMQQFYGKDINLKSKSKGRNKDLFKNEFIEIKKTIEKEKEEIDNLKKEKQNLINNDKWIGLNEIKKIDDKKEIKKKSFFSKEEIITLDVEDYQKIYKMAKDNSKKLTDYHNAYTQIKNKNIELTKENTTLKNQNEELKTKNIELEKKNSNIFAKLKILYSFVEKIIPKNLFKILKENVLENQNLNLWNYKKYEKETLEKMNLNSKEDKYIER